MGHLYFFIGTEAELIKLLPLIKKIIEQKINYKIIASGQNNIAKSDLLKLLEIEKLDFVLYNKNIKQTAVNLFIWFFKTLIKGVIILNGEFKNIDKKDSAIIVHGDTVSTVMGAVIGKIYGFKKIIHLEAGLRSFNYFHPFPEEINRLLTSFLANIYFCPNQWAVDNLKRKKGIKINTFQNTLIDSLNIAAKQNINSELMQKINQEKYFIFVLHRTENLFSKELVGYLIDLVIDISRRMKCVFVLHDLTKANLERMNLIGKLSNQGNILLTPRLSYLEFMKILFACEYIMTDGGSNQEETYYLGKPALILRRATERQEGVGENVVISKNNHKIIGNFIKNYKNYSRPKVDPKIRPTDIIFDYLINN